MTLLLLMFLCQLAWAEDEESEATEEGEEAAAAAAPIYIPLKPQFVVNYGGAGKLKFLKAGVTLRLANADAANAVQHHLPFIRHKLVMVFAGQTDETLESMDGREAMRQTALADIRSLLTLEEKMDNNAVVDLLFNTLTWH